jgi:DNA-binding NarL/FixJ family response regulator
VRSNGLSFTFRAQNSGVKAGSEPPPAASEFSAREGPETTILVAVESAQVREALVAMLGALDGFRVVAEACNDEAALEAARRQRPRLALIEPELSGCGGWWAIQQIRAERLAGVVVALGRRANDGLARLAGAQSYVQMGVSPRDLLSALEAAIAFRTSPISGVAETEKDLLADANAVLDKPALVDL